MKRRLAIVVSVVVFAALACVTINVYFPEAAIKDLSKQIEAEVQKQAAKEGHTAAPPATPEPQQPVTPPQEPTPRVPQVDLLDALFGVAYAAENVPSPEVSNPAIRRIIDSRASRVAELNRYKASGAIGESNRALIEIRALDVVSDLKARAELQRLVKAENADREELFREIASAKGVDMSQLDKIRTTYAATLRENARPGDWIQAADGNWSKK